MQRITYALAALAALVFIVASGTINSLFLSSLGRTVPEAWLFAAVSIASDISKAILPVVIAWALARRAWFHAVIAGVFLAMAMTLSLGSGVGFTAWTRGAVTADREGLGQRLAQAEADLAQADRRLASMASARSVDVVEEDLKALLTDRRWTASDSCADPSWRAARKFCAKVFRMRAELAVAKKAVEVSAGRKALRSRIKALRAQGAGEDVDPQAEAISRLVGLAPRLVRLALMIMVAVVLELGSVCLLLLIAGPAMAQTQARRPAPRSASGRKSKKESKAAAVSEPPAEKPKEPAVLPVQADRLQWAKKRMKKEA